MTGLEKMQSRILEDARTQARARVEEAERQAAQIREEARSQAEKEAERILKQAREGAGTSREKTASSADLDRRTRILAAKQKMIAEILENAYRSIGAMNAEEYFGLIGRLLEQYALPQDGQIRFSPADAGRMPENFEKKIQETAAAKGGSLTIAPPDPAVQDGFILVYGGVEENCTFRAIFDARHDEMSDLVQHMLFS